MYQTSDKCREEIVSNMGHVTGRLIKDGHIIHEEIKSITLNMTSNNADTLTLGSVTSSYIEGTLRKPDITIDGYEVEFQIGVALDNGWITGNDNYEWITMGYFTIKAEDSEDVIHITAYDRMMQTERAYFSDLPNNTDTVAVLNEISDQCGVAIVTTGLEQIPIEKPQGYTCRETLSYIAQLHGRFAVCNRNGEIVLKWYEESELQYTADDYASCNFTRNDFDYVLQKIEVAIGTTTNADGEEETDILSVGEGVRSVGFSNPWMTQAILDKIFADIGGFTYTPGEVHVTLGDPRLDPWDIITVTDLNGDQYRIPCMSCSFTYSGGYSGDIEAVGESEEEAELSWQGPMTTLMERMASQLILVDKLIANTISVEYLEAHYAKITNLEALQARIDVLEANSITVEYLEANYATINYLEAYYASIADLEANYAQIKDLDALHARITTLEANSVTTDYLQANYATINYVQANFATITDLEAAYGNIILLQSEVASINTLLAGNLTSANIQSLHLSASYVTVEDAFIKDAMIASLSADKITAGSIITNYVNVHSENGQMYIADNTIQIRDNASTARVQIGEDDTGDYSMYVWDANGNLMFDALGLHEDGIKSGIIKDSMVADDANIAGYKVDIESLVTEVNNSSYTIKASRIIYDAAEQTLDIQLKQMQDEINAIEVIGEENYILQTYATGYIEEESHWIDRDGAYFTDHSGNQLTFMSGGRVATIHARVYCNNEDVTDEMDEEYFLWSRRSEYRDEDDEWNVQKITGKDLTITGDDVEMVGTYVCTFTLPDTCTWIDLDGAYLTDHSGNHLIFNES